MSAVAWLRRWGPRLGGVVGTQGLVQACNALSGILVVWLLPRETAYAWFTVASSMMIMATLLADPGMTAAVHALGGPAWQEPVRFTQIIRAVQRHQRWLSGLAVILVIPWLVVLLLRLQAPVWAAVLAAMLVAAFVWPSATAQIWSGVNRLHSRLRPQLLAELAGAGTRLLLTATGLGLAAFLAGGLLLGSQSAAFPAAPAFVAMVAASCLPVFLYHHLVRREATRVLDPQAEATTEHNARIRGIIGSTSAFTIYYGLQGQVSTWLISLHGATAQVADVGALNRLGLLFALAGAPLVQLAGPAFARCKEPAQLRRQLLLTASLYGLFATGILLLVTVLPGPVLWLLGPQYAHLGAELRLAVLVLAVTGISGMVWGLTWSRGWVKSSALIIPVGLIAQMTGLFLFDLSTVSSVLSFNLFILLPVLLLACAIVARGFQTWKKAIKIAA